MVSLPCEIRKSLQSPVPDSMCEEVAYVLRGFKELPGGEEITFGWGSTDTELLIYVYTKEDR